MNVLVVVGSKHGSTREIATAIADQLTRTGHHATTADAQSPPGNFEPYDALVMGSAIYMGHHNATLLATKPIWLFSSGPLGESSGSTKPDPQMEEYIELLKPKGHAIFSGALDKSDLNLLERAGIRAAHAPYGDYRPWDEINAWTDEIANELQHLPTAV